MEDYTVSAWVNSLAREELEDFLDNHKPAQAPPPLHPWASPNLRKFLVSDSPERGARQKELMENLHLQQQLQKKARHYPTLMRLCEMMAEWEEMCRLSKGIRGLQGRSLLKLEESEKSLRLRLLERIRLAQIGCGDNERLAIARPFHHLNLYGDQVYASSKTPAQQSF